MGFPPSCHGPEVMLSLPGALFHSNFLIFPLLSDRMIGGSVMWLLLRFCYWRIVGPGAFSCYIVSVMFQLIAEKFHGFESVKFCTISNYYL